MPTTYSIEIAALAAALKTLLPIIPKKEADHWSGGVRLHRARNRTLRLSAMTCGWTAAFVTVPLAGDASGDDEPATIPAWGLADLLKGRDGAVTIRLDGGEVAVTLTDGVGFTWQAKPWMLEPRIMDSRALAAFTTDAGALAAALRKSLPFAAKGDVRYDALNGVCLAVRPDESVEVVASDRHKLIRSTLSADDVDADAEALPALPVETVKGLVALLDSAPGDVLVVATESELHFRTASGAYLSARLASGAFPRYREILPTVTDTSPRVILDRAATIAALKRLPCKASDPNVTLSPTAGGTALKLAGAGAATTVPAYTAKCPGGIVFEARLLVDVLKSAEDDSITLYFSPKPGGVASFASGASVLLMPKWDCVSEAYDEVDPAERGAESLEAALQMPDPIQPKAATKVKDVAPKTIRTRKVTTDQVLAWLSNAGKDDLDRIAAALDSARNPQIRGEAA